MRWLSAAESRASTAGRVGVLAAIAACAAYLPGAGRNFGLDAAITFGNWVATPRFGDAFGRATGVEGTSLAYASPNNHVLLSVLSHVIFSLTGSTNEAVYRVIPIAAGAATVGLVCFFLVQRFGTLPGLAAAVFVATNPIFVENARDLRGYSLMLMFVVLATVALDGEPTVRRVATYALLMGLAIAAQAFAVLVILGHVVILAGTHRERLRGMLPGFIAGGLLGAVANAGVAVVVLTNAGAMPRRLFVPDFPLRLVFDLLGAPSPLSVAFWMTTVALGLFALRRRVWLVAITAGLAGVIVLLWLVVQPPFLYSRFFIFLVPAYAYLIAAAVQRWRLLAVVVGAGAVLAIASQLPAFVSDPLATRQAGAIIEAAHASGKQACVLAYDDIVVVAYAHDFRRVGSAEDLAGCDLVVIASWDPDPAVKKAAVAAFPNVRLLPAGYPALVLTRP